MQKSGLQRVQFVAIMSLHFRGRAAVATAAAAADASMYLRDALCCARRLEGERCDWARMNAFVLRAGVASVNGDKPAAHDLLERAEADAEAAHMSHYVAACRYQRGRFVGGPDGQVLIARAMAWAAAQHVVDPRRIFDMLAPGRWDSY
jgi:hypothetical protein